MSSEAACMGDFCPEYGGGRASEYSVSSQRVARHVWVLRSHAGPGGRYGDPWVGFCLLRAERYCPGGFWGWFRGNWWRPWRRPVAHLFATVGRYPLSAHRRLEEVLRSMGFTARYHERVKNGRLVPRVVDLPSPRPGSDTVSKSQPSDP